jgi:hypothetical protein
MLDVYHSVRLLVNRSLALVWESIDMSVFGEWKIALAFVRCMDNVAHVDGVTAVWVTVAVMVSDVCVVARYGVTAAWVPVVVLVSDIGVAGGGLG